MLIVTDAWREAYPGATAGVLLVREVINPESHVALEARKVELEKELRARYASFDRASLSQQPSIQPYVTHYSRFKKTYHVLLQLESVLFKGKSLPRVAALVECMFMAELKNQLLTAGHDWAAVRGSVRLDIAHGDETYTLYNGHPQVLKAGDMFIADEVGVISNVVYGPDQRTRITASTQAALFTVYGPPGITVASVSEHLQDIWTNIRIVSPEAVLDTLKVYHAA